MRRSLGNLQIVTIELDIVQEYISVILTNIDSKGFLRRQLGENDHNKVTSICFCSIAVLVWVCFASIQV